MHGGNTVYGPQELELLQQIFDSVWRHLERIGRVHGDDDAIRNWVSAKVMACAKDKDLLETDAIKVSVLKSLHQ
jgi:hypothetical protein